MRLRIRKGAWLLQPWIFEPKVVTNLLSNIRNIYYVTEIDCTRLKIKKEDSGNYLTNIFVSKLLCT